MLQLVRTQTYTNVFKRFRNISCFGTTDCTMDGFAAFVEKLDNLSRFRLHTGNINSYTELKSKRYADSSEELEACLKLQLQGTPQTSDFRDDGTLLLCDKEHVSKYERDDLRITIKVFLSSWNPNEVTESVMCLIDQLKTDDIETLILATPEVDIVAGESEEAEVQRWLSALLPVWRVAELLLKERKISSLGISDAGIAKLKALYNAVELKPNVDHLKMDGCCLVPPELQEFAREHDIQLLTHNDPIPTFPVSEVFNKFCDLRQTLPICQSKFRATWAARYTVWVRRRSIMASKGYIVQFQRN